MKQGNYSRPIFLFLKNSKNKLKVSSLTSSDIVQYVYCNCLTTKLWHH